MTQSQHTAGPWKVGYDDSSGHEYITVDNKPIATVSWGCGCCKRDDITDQQRADARLIAAAPELLEALEDLSGLEVKGHALLDRLQFSESGRALSARITAAIARAKGLAV